MGFRVPHKFYLPYIGEEKEELSPKELLEAKVFWEKVPFKKGKYHYTILVNQLVQGMLLPKF